MNRSIVRVLRLFSSALLLSSVSLALPALSARASSGWGYWDSYGRGYPGQSLVVGYYPSYRSSIYVCRSWDSSYGVWRIGTSYNGLCNYAQEIRGIGIRRVGFEVLVGVSRHSWRDYESSWYDDWRNDWRGWPGYDWRYSTPVSLSDASNPENAEAAPDTSLKEVCRGLVNNVWFVGRIAEGKCHMPSPTGVDLIRPDFEVLVIEP